MTNNELVALAILWSVLRMQRAGSKYGHILPRAGRPLSLPLRRNSRLAPNIGCRDIQYLAPMDPYKPFQPEIPVTLVTSEAKNVTLNPPQEWGFQAKNATLSSDRFGPIEHLYHGPHHQI